MSKRFTVIDGSNAYYLLDNVTGLEACMGDGVDVLFDEMYGEFVGLEPERSKFPGVGTEAFRVAWEKDANEDAGVYFGAYFYRLDSLVIYDDDCEMIDRYTVLVRPASLLECAVYSMPGLWACLCLSDGPGGPQGFSQWGFAVPHKRLGEVIHFLKLPDNVQKHIVERLEEGEDERQPDTAVVPDDV